MTYESFPPADLPGLPESPELTALLAAARPGAAAGPEGEDRALGAFRAARDEGAHAAVSPLRRRRRDDWRPVVRRRGARSARLLVGGFAAALALGGVAVAGGSGVIPTPFGGTAPEVTPPVRSAPAVPPRTDGRGKSDEVTAVPGAGPATAGAGPAQGDAGLCRAYREAGNSADAADPAVVDRLAGVAGGKSAVPAYCDGLLGPQSEAKPRSTRSAQGDREPRSADPATGNANSGGSANSDGNGNSGGNARGGGSANGNENADGDRGKPATG